MVKGSFEKKDFLFGGIFVEIAFYRKDFEEKKLIYDREKLIDKVLSLDPIIKGVFHSYEEDPELIGAVLHAGHDGWNLFIPKKADPERVITALNGILVS